MWDGEISPSWCLSLKRRKRKERGCRKEESSRQFNIWKRIECIRGTRWTIFSSAKYRSVVGKIRHFSSLVSLCQRRESMWNDEKNSRCIRTHWLPPLFFHLYLRSLGPLLLPLHTSSSCVSGPVFLIVQLPSRSVTLPHFRGRYPCLPRSYLPISICLYFSVLTFSSFTLTCVYFPSISVHFGFHSFSMSFPWFSVFCIQLPTPTYSLQILPIHFIKLQKSEWTHLSGYRFRFRENVSFQTAPVPTITRFAGRYDDMEMDNYRRHGANDCFDQVNHHFKSLIIMY